MPARRLGIGAVVVATTVALTSVITTQSASPSGAQAAAAPADRPNIVLITTDDQTPRRHEVHAAHSRRDREAGSHLPRDALAAPAVLPRPGRDPHRPVRPEQRGAQQQPEPVRRLRLRCDNRNTIATWLKDAGYSHGVRRQVPQPPTKSRDGQRARLGHLEPADQAASTSTSTTTLYNNGDPRDVLRRPPGRRDRRPDRRRTSASSRPRTSRSSSGPRTWPRTTAAAATTTTFNCGTAPDRRRAAPQPVRHRARRPSLRDPAFNEKNVSDKPPEIAQAARVEAERDQPAGSASGSGRSRPSTRRCSRRVRTLAETGELDNTLILFTSDNGYLLGEHRYIRKDVPYEQALRTPLLVRGPGVPAGVTRDPDGDAGRPRADDRGRREGQSHDRDGRPQHAAGSSATTRAGTRRC